MMNPEIKDRIEQMKNSEVLEGYTFSKVGIIPGDWEHVKLGSIGTFKKGKNISLKDTQSMGLPAMMYGDIYIKYDTYFNDVDYRISTGTAEKSTVINKGDILFTCSGETAKEIGKCVCYLGDEPIYIGGDILAFTQNNNDSLFLGYQQNYYSMIKQKASLGQGHSVVHIYEKHISSLNILLPPLPEQQKIAQILSTWDKAITLQEKLIEEKKEQKRGLMQRLLTGELRLPGFNGEWEEVRLGEVCDVKGGKRLPKGYSLQDKNNGFPYIRVSDMKENGVCLDEIKYVPTDIADKISQYKISATDIYISVAGTLGIIGIVPIQLDNANLTENADKLTNIICNQQFLYYIMLSEIIQRNIESVKTNNAQPKLAINQIKSFIISIPNIKEQQAIAEMLTKTDKEIHLQQNALDALIEQKKGLMQLLLTGIVRVEV